MSTFKQAANEEVALVAQALASPRRLELLDYLIQLPRSVEALAELSGMSVANTSRHLQILRQSGLVKVDRQGTRRIYAIAGEDVIRLLVEIHRTARMRRGQLDRLLHNVLEEGERLEPLDAETLQARLQSGEAVLLDVRPEDEYRAGHIPGARSMPVETLERRLHHLPREREIVAYCRGPFCVYAHQAVALLQRAGFRARRLELGMPAWIAAGRPVQRAQC